MRDDDYDAFLREFKRLTAALEKYRQPADQVADKADAYFHVLKQFPLSLVIAKADRWLETEKKFPAPSEWANLVVTRKIDHPVLSDEQARDWKRAESLGWEDAPCSCRDCQAANVSEKPLRFVPDFTPEDTALQVVCFGKVVTAGHWAHGWELVRWYQARGNFWNRAYELGLMTPVEKKRLEKLPLSEQLARIFAKRSELEPVK